jgi:molecular chaperone GrpE
MTDNQPQDPEQETDDPQLQYKSADNLDELDVLSEAAAAEEFATGENPAGDDDAGSDDLVLGLQKKLAESEKRCLIAQADLENFRRRNRKETQDQLRYASSSLMIDLLDAVDNLHRAVESYEQATSSEGGADSGTGDALNEGVKLVADQIKAALSKQGCKPIQAVGHPFDPNLHQALQMQASDEFPAQTVMMDLRTGFQLHERVLRPSQVFVSTGPAE